MTEEKTEDDEIREKGHLYENRLSLSFKSKSGNGFNAELLFNWREIFIIVLLICLGLFAVCRLKDRERQIMQIRQQNEQRIEEQIRELTEKQLEEQIDLQAKEQIMEQIENTNPIVLEPIPDKN